MVNVTFILYTLVIINYKIHLFRGLKKKPCLGWLGEVLKNVPLISLIYIVQSSLLVESPCLMVKSGFSMVQPAEDSGWLPHAPVQPPSLQFARGRGSHGAVQNGSMPLEFCRFLGWRSTENGSKWVTGWWFGTFFIFPYVGKCWE